MAMAASDATLKEIGSGAVGLHLGIVVGFERDAIKIAEVIEEAERDVTKISGVANAVAKAVDYEAMGTKPVMREVHWVASKTVDRRESFVGEWSYERRQLGRALRQGIGFIGVTIDRDVEAAECRTPTRRIVVAVEVREAKGTDISRADTGALETLCERARADSGVNKRIPAGDRMIAAFPAEPLARMQSSRDIGLACESGARVSPGHVNAARSRCEATDPAHLPVMWHVQQSLLARILGNLNWKRVMVHNFNEGEELPNGKTKQWTIRPNDCQPIAIAVIFGLWQTGRRHSIRSWR